MSFLRVLSCCILLAWSAGCSERRADYFPGYAEGDYVRLSSAAGGTLVKLHLERGARVEAGAPAFELERESEEAAYREAGSRLGRAQAQVANLTKGARPDELEAARAQLDQAEAALRLSEAEFQRQERLAAVKFIAPAQLDQARSARARDRARVDESRARLRLARQGARSDEIAAARQDVLAAEAQLAQAAWVLDQKSRKVPEAAAVVDVLFREGEWVPPGAPVVSLLPPQNIKARFFVGEGMLGRLRLGQRVTLQCDGCGAPLEAAVSFIAPEAEYTAPLIYSKENRAALVFMAEARPDPEQARRLHPGQPLEIRLAEEPQ
ncbi:MAG: HlyD family secretion protein [Noviherbaspirillum sp.]